MNLPATLFVNSNDWLLLWNGAFIALLAKAIWHAEWGALWRNPKQFNAYVALSLFTPVFWMMNAGIHPGLNFHLLGATLFTLMFGWAIALITLAGVMLTVWLYHGLDVAALGINGVVMLAMPILLSEALLRISQDKLPPNPFQFLLLNAFACAGCSVLLVMVTTALLMLLLGQHSWQAMSHDYLIFAPAMIFAEAFTTGAMITGFLVSQPEAMLHSKIEYPSTTIG